MGKQRPLQRHAGAIIIGFIYLACLAVSWGLTCSLADKERWGAMNLDYKFNSRKTNFDAMLGAAKFLGAVADLSALPVITFLLARAAVLFSQRSRRNQSLSVRQLFALADQRFFPSAFEDEEKSALAQYGAALLLFACLTPPIKSLVVPSAVLYIPRGVNTTVGFDPDPGSLVRASQVDIVEKTRHNILSAAWDDVHPRLWKENNTIYRDDYDQYVYNTFKGYYRWPSFDGMTPSWYHYRPRYFVSALQTNTTTGSRQNFATRVNSTVTCSNNGTVFPSTCSGARPFTATFADEDNFQISICVPGAFDRSPWEERRTMQTLTEEIYMRIAPTSAQWYYEDIDSFIVHCEATSTLGSFELGNHLNNGIHGLLYSESFDHVWKGWQDEYWPPENDISYEIDSTPVPGPLMTATLALFGNETFFPYIANMTNTTASPVFRRICDDGLMPFRRIITDPMARCKRDTSFSGRETEDELSAEDYSEVIYMLDQFFTLMYDNEQSKTVLELAMYFANEAWLTTAASTQEWVRRILADTGVRVIGPSMSTGVFIFMTVLIGIQGVMIIILILYISSSRTWTPSLDALAIARIALQLKDGGALSRMGLLRPREADLKPLGEIDGLVGVVEAGTEMQMMRSSFVPQRHDTEPPPPPDADDRPPPYVGNTEAPEETRQEEQQVSGLNGPAASISAPPSAPPLNPPEPLELGPAVSLELNPPYTLRVGGQGLVTRRLARSREHWAAV